MAKLSFPPEELPAHVVSLRERLLAAPDENIDPFGRLRALSTKSTWDALEDLGRAKAMGDSAWLRGAKAHVAFFISARLSWDELAIIETLRDTRNSDLKALPFACQTPRGLARALVSAPDANVRALFEKLPLAISDLRAHARAVAERRLEVEQRLGCTDVLGLGFSRASLRESAISFLSRTRDLAMAAQRRLVIPPGPFSERALWMVRHAMLTKTITPWPARLSPQWLRETFPHFATPRIDPSTGPAAARALLRTPPERLGGASFLRYLARFGETLGKTLPETANETLERADPSDVAALSWGVVFAMLGAQEVFHRRCLDASGPTAAEGVREHAGSLLTSLGALALAVLAELRADGSEWEESVYGASLPRGLSGCWPMLHPSPLALWSGFLGAFAELERLRDMFDEDWFRNPRAAEYFLVGRPLLTEAPSLALATQFFEEHLA
jgi:hypothetical protein